MYKLSKNEVIQHKEALCEILDELYELTHLDQFSQRANEFYKEYASMITAESNMFIHLDARTNHHTIVEKCGATPIHLFKAKTSRDDKWVYGSPLYGYSDDTYEVIGFFTKSTQIDIQSSTLCESFQKYDIYKHLVYTHDIVLVHDERFKRDTCPIYEVYYDASNSEYCIRNKFESMSIANVENFEVISNIFNEMHLDSNGIAYDVGRWLYE